MSSRIEIEIAENGFIVCESVGDHSIGRTWAFESSESLANFIADWGDKITKARITGD